MSQYQSQIDAFMESVKARNGHEPEFLQAVEEVAEAVIPYIEAIIQNISDAEILNRIVEPERVLMFRVPWVDDQG